MSYKGSRKVFSQVTPTRRYHLSSTIPQLFTTAFLIQIVALGMKVMECQEDIDVATNSSGSGFNEFDQVNQHCTVHRTGSLAYPTMVSLTHCFEPKPTQTKARARRHRLCACALCFDYFSSSYILLIRASAFLNVSRCWVGATRLWDLHPGGCADAFPSVLHDRPRAV